MRDGKVSMITRKEGLPGQQVTALLEDDRGVLWMGMDRDLFSYSNGRFKKRVRSDGEPTGMVVGMAEDANQSIWIVTAVKDRLLRLDAKTGIAQVVAKPRSPSRIASSPNGVVYLLSFLSGEISSFVTTKPLKMFRYRQVQGQVKTSWHTIKSRCSWARPKGYTAGKIEGGPV